MDGKWVGLPLEHHGAYGAMGGLITTIEEFTAYVALHMSAWPPRSGAEGMPLKRSSLREMHFPWNFSSLMPGFRYPSGRPCPSVSAYGYGLRWMTDCSGRVMVGHSGGLPGFGSNWTMMPDYGLAVMSFDNRTYGGTSTLNMAVLDTIIALTGLEARRVVVPAILETRKSQLVEMLPERGVPARARPSREGGDAGRGGAVPESRAALARIAALADAHEKTPLDYLLVLAPVAYLGLNAPGEWDERLHSTMESVFAGCAEDYPELEYKANVTVRQLMHVNSRRWAAKALSVGESLGLRVVYPYIWQTILREQGRLPWSAKVHDGVVKWPLKKLLEEFMPAQFIYRKKSGFVPPFARWLTEREFNGKVRDILLSRDALVTTIVTPALLERLINDALRGERLRHSILNFLWAAIFVESWLRQHARKA